MEKVIVYAGEGKRTNDKSTDCRWWVKDMWADFQTYRLGSSGDVGNCRSTWLISKFVTERGFSVAIALILAVLVATALGFIDGVIIAKIKVPPLIMTLGMQIFLYGFTYSICEGKPVYGIPASLTWIGQTYLFKVIPVSATKSSKNFQCLYVASIT